MSENTGPRTKLTQTLGLLSWASAQKQSYSEAVRLVRMPSQHKVVTHPRLQLLPRMRMKRTKSAFWRQQVGYVGSCGSCGILCRLLRSKEMPSATPRTRGSQSS